MIRLRHEECSALVGLTTGVMFVYDSCLCYYEQVSAARFKKEKREKSHIHNALFFLSFPFT